MRALAYLVLFVCVSTPTSYGANLDINHTTFQLGNGLNVIVIPNHRIPLVTQMVWYRVGAQQETSGQTGLAHLLEHMMFKQTHNLNEGEFSELLAYYGATENAFTSHDVTAYYQTLPREYLPLAMVLEAGRMNDLVIDVDEFATENQVVMEERLQRVDNHPSARLVEQMRQQLFADHPYSRPVTGWPEEIKTLSPEAAMAFYRCYYVPNNATLILSGDITPEDARPLAERYYGHIAATPVCEPKHDMPAQATAPTRPVLVMHERVSRPDIVMSYRVPTIGTSEDVKLLASLTLLQDLLGNASRGALYQEFVLEQNIATSASASFDAFRQGPGSFTLYFVPSDVNDTLEVWSHQVTALLDNLADKRFSEQELQRSVTSLKASVIYALDGNDAIARMVGTVDSLGKTPDFLQEWIATIEAVTPDDIHAAIVALSNSPSVMGMTQLREAP